VFVLKRHCVVGADNIMLHLLCTRYTACTHRYVSVMARVFVLAGDLMQPDVANSLMQLIAEGGGEGDQQDIQVTEHSVIHA
jgi:hypothetical protein